MVRFLLTSTVSCTILTTVHRKRMQTPNQVPDTEQSTPDGTKPQQVRRLQVEIPEEAHRRLRIFAADNGESYSQAVTRLLKALPATQGDIA